MNALIFGLLVFVLVFLILLRAYFHKPAPPRLTRADARAAELGRLKVGKNSEPR